MRETELVELPTTITTEATTKESRVEEGELDVPAVQRDGVAESLPTPDEIRATVNPRRSRNRRSANQRTAEAAVSGWGLGMLCFFLSLLAVVILSVGLGVGLSNRAESEDLRESTDLTNEESTDITSEESADLTIEDYVVAKGISSVADFALDYSPQSKAARWMAQDDTLNLPIPRYDFDLYEDEDTFQFVLRYVMAVVYFSTGGDHWQLELNFLSDRATCSWYRRFLTNRGDILTLGLLCYQNRHPFAIYLDNLGATGTVPNELGVLKSLNTVSFNFNDFLAGTIPVGLCELSNLEILAMGFNEMKGEIPPCIDRLSNLRVLFLPNANFEGALPTMSNMVNLKQVYLDDNYLSGDITTAFNGLVLLQILFLEDNQFTGTVDSNFLRNNPQLIEVDISDNQLNGDLPLHMFEFEDLVLLDLHGNRFNGTLPPFVTSHAMEFLALHDNKFSGSIPPTINNFYKLKHLDLSNNALTGNIPSQLGDLTNLTYLFLADNNFQHDVLPDSFANLVNLVEFSVKRTGRFGVLPDWISSWKNLMLLDLAVNNFEGALPVSYANLTNLEFMLLNDNPDLTHSVPTQYARLEKLRAFFLDGTGVEGDLAHMCRLDTFRTPNGDIGGEDILMADCQQEGLITCTCCVCCFSDGSDGPDPRCNDNNRTANLNPYWESGYQRVQFNFGNDTRFVDQTFLP